MNVHMLSDGDSNLALVQQVATQIDQNRIKFTAMGFFDINYKTLSSVIHFLYFLILNYILNTIFLIVFHHINHVHNDPCPVRSHTKEGSDVRH